MSPRRLPLFLIVALCLVPGSSGGHSGQPSCRLNRGNVAADIISSSFVARTASPSPSLLRLTPWRYRLKSVVETSDPRGPEPVALGRAPVLVPDHLILPVARSPRIARSRALVPLAVEAVDRPRSRSHLGRDIGVRALTGPPSDDPPAASPVAPALIGVSRRRTRVPVGRSRCSGGPAPPARRKRELPDPPSPRIALPRPRSRVRYPARSPGRLRRRTAPGCRRTIAGSFMVDPAYFHYSFR